MPITAIRFITLRCDPNPTVNWCVYSQFADHFGDQLLAAAKVHEALILREVLGVRLERVETGVPPDAERFDVDGSELHVLVRRAEGDDPT